MDCPQCGAVMRERDRAGIKIDFCPDCKGVWLDRGELDKIIEHEARGEDWNGDDDRERGDRRDDRRDDRYESERRSEYRSEYRGDYKPKSKKKSFFESLTEMVGGEGGD